MELPLLPLPRVDSPWVLVQLLDPDNRDPLHAEDDDPIDDKHRVDIKTNINILMMKSIIENKQIVTAENKQIVTVENKQIVTAENKQIVTAENKQIVTAENKQIVTVENKQIVTAENKRVCNSEDDKLLTRVMNCIHKQYTKVMTINKVIDKRVQK